MKYVFFGTPEFAALVLERLVEAGMPPVAVVCNPDRPVGRKHIVTPPPAKEIAALHGIPVLQPEKLSAAAEELRALEADLFVVAAYGKIMRREIFDMPRFKTVCVHPSLLPRHRGATPIQTAILEGDAETGTSFIFIDEQVDHGPVIAAAKLAGYDPDAARAETLARELAELSAKELLALFPKFEAGGITAKPQDESLATFTKKFAVEDGFVPEETLAAAERGENPAEAAELGRKIRALNPEPGVWTVRGGVRVKLLEASVSGGKLALKKIHVAGKSNPQTL